MPSVLFVCTANICRSPVAEVLFADWLKRQSVPGDWEVGSAGTWADEGNAASAHSRGILLEQGLDLTQHRSRRVDAPMLAATGVVLCMTRSQQEALQIEFRQYASRIHMLTSMAGPAYDVDDPIGGPRSAYLEMINEVRGLLEAGGARIVSLASRAEPLKS